MQRGNLTIMFGTYLGLTTGGAKAIGVYRQDCNSGENFVPGVDHANAVILLGELCRAKHDTREELRL